MFCGHENDRFLLKLPADMELVRYHQVLMLMGHLFQKMLKKMEKRKRLGNLGFTLWWVLSVCFTCSNLIYALPIKSMPYHQVIP